MAVGPKVEVVPPEWMDLRQLTAYAAVSERTLRTWIYSASAPLPASKVGAKILVRRQDFDAWLEAHRIKPLASETVNVVLSEIMNGLAN